MLLKKIQKRIFTDYANEDLEIVDKLLEKQAGANLLDVGCGDGKLTLTFAKRAKTKEIFGLEYVTEDIKKAKTLGINCKKADLNQKFPFLSNTFDILISHFSFEHIINVRRFVKECHRVLKPGGYMLVTSDNLNSWLNIFAMMLTFQPFSTTRGLSDKPAGNPFSFWTETETKEWNDRDDRNVVGAGTHTNVLSARAALDVFANYGFVIESFKGAGYFPFWGLLSKIFAKIDPYHSHLYILKARKTPNDK